VTNQIPNFIFCSTVSLRKRLINVDIPVEHKGSDLRGVN